MEYLKPFKIVVDLFLKLLGIRSDREKEKVQRVIEYIDTCVHHLKVVMQFDDHNESETDYSRVFLQKAYHETPKHLDGVATAKQYMGSDTIFLRCYTLRFHTNNLT